MVSNPGRSKLQNRYLAIQVRIKEQHDKLLEDLLQHRQPGSTKVKTIELEFLWTDQNLMFKIKRCTSFPKDHPTTEKGMKSDLNTNIHQI